MHKTLPDEVDAAWSIDGRLFYKNNMGSIHRVWHDYYQTLVDLLGQNQQNVLLTIRGINNIYWETGKIYFSLIVVNIYQCLNVIFFVQNDVTISKKGVIISYTYSHL